MTRRSERLPARIARLPIPGPVQFATYPGDATSAVGQVVGPMIGSDQLLTCVAADHDQAADTTRLGFTYGDLSDRFEEAS